MKAISFTKMVASGNDFVVVEKIVPATKTLAGRHSLQSLTKKICDRKYGVGADGLLILEKSNIADTRMRIFNTDGSEAEMCGNGARCVARLLSANCKVQSTKLNLETKAGIIETEVSSGNIRIKLTDPNQIKLDLPIKINNRALKVNFINTGVAHAVIFVAGLDKIDVVNLGRQIRYHRAFAPKGTNADFVQVVNHNSIKLRTYERGVENETLACGTGAVASAIIFSLKSEANKRINVYTKSGQVLKVYFEKEGNKFKDVWLEGQAKIIYKGVYYV